jgi:hypothetical protein
MRTELLSVRRLTAGIVYPPYQLNQQQVNRIYAEITDRYPFQTLQHLPDGARMANPNGDFFIQTTRMQVNDSVDYFQTSKERALDLFKLTQERLQIPQFLTFGVKLTAFLPVEGDKDAADAIENAVFSHIQDELELLGPGRRGVGMRLVLHQDGVYELKIEPFFSDTSQLYVELDVQHPSPFDDLAVLEPRMDAAYNYIFNEVSDFLNAL